MSIQDEHLDDAVNVAPHLHTIVFEDDKMRVLKVVVRPGDIAKMHWHPRNINYVLAGGTLRFTRPDGTVAEVELVNGQVTSAASDSEHAVENIGTTIVETLQVETK